MTEFNKQSTGRQGVRADCRTCRSKSDAIHRSNPINKKKKEEDAAKYHSKPENKARKAARIKKRYADDSDYRDKLLAQCRERYAYAKEMRELQEDAGFEQSTINDNEL